MQLFIDISDIEGLEDQLQEIENKIDQQERLRLAILACLSDSSIDAELLKQLIASTNKPQMNQVLWLDGFLYATNGHIAAKIEADEQDTSHYCDQVQGSIVAESIKRCFDDIQPTSQEILVNPRYLKLVGEIFEHLGLSEIRMETRGAVKALTFIGRKETGESIELIMMPIKPTQGMGE